MKPPPFTLSRAQSIDECVALLAGSDGDVKPIAGGQSLLPMLALRMARPARLVDLGGVEDLRGCGIAGDELFLGARITHRELARDQTLAVSLPLLGTAARHIGHDGIRNRGTLGGSLAHADPAAELPAVMALISATMVCASARGVRHVAAREFFLGPYTSALEPDELLVGVRLRLPAAPTRYGFAELAVREGDFARAGAVCALPAEPRDGNDAELVMFAVDGGPIHVTVAGADTDDPRSICAAVDDQLRARGLPPPRARLAHLCVRRAVAQALGGEAP